MLYNISISLNKTTSGYVWSVPAMTYDGAHMNTSSDLGQAVNDSYRLATRLYGMQLGHVSWHLH